MNSISPASAQGLVIENGIPLPASTRASGPITTALRGMLVGQSIFFPGKDTAGATSMVSGARSSNHKHLKYAVRKVEGGARIWRTA